MYSSRFDLNEIRFCTYTIYELKLFNPGAMQQDLILDWMFIR